MADPRSDESASIHYHQSSRSRQPQHVDSDIYRRLNAMETWAAEHRGACTERAKNRDAWQERTDGEISRLEDSVVSLKVRLALIAGAAAAGGGAIGGAVARLFGP